MGGSNFSRWGELPLLLQMGGGMLDTLRSPPSHPIRGTPVSKFIFFAPQKSEPPCASFKCGYIF